MSKTIEQLEHELSLRLGKIGEGAHWERYNCSWQDGKTVHGPMVAVFLPSEPKPKQIASIMVLINDYLCPVEELLESTSVTDNGRKKWKVTFSCPRPSWHRHTNPEYITEKEAEEWFSRQTEAKRWIINKQVNAIAAKDRDRVRSSIKREVIKKAMVEEDASR